MHKSTDKHHTMLSGAWGWGFGAAPAHPLGFSLLPHKTLAAYRFAFAHLTAPYQGRQFVSQHRDLRPLGKGRRVFTSSRSLSPWPIHTTEYPFCTATSAQRNTPSHP